MPGQSENRKFDDFRHNLTRIDQLGCAGWKRRERQKFADDTAVVTVLAIIAGLVVISCTIRMLVLKTIVPGVEMIVAVRSVTGMRMFRPIMIRANCLATVVVVLVIVPRRGECVGAQIAREQQPRR